MDKYAVREYVKEKIGEEYLVPLLGVWDSPKQIDFDLLPNQFVLKTNHDSGSVVICKDKASFNKKKACAFLREKLGHNYFWPSREWPYKNVPPKIIAEQYLEDTAAQSLPDYKFYTFSGKAKMMLIATDRQKGATKYDYFDLAFSHINMTWGGPNAPVPPDKPLNFEKMVCLAEKLSEGIPEVRVDFYECNGRLFFGEMTFFDGGGFSRIEPFEQDIQMGEWLHLA